MCQRMLATYNLSILDFKYNNSQLQQQATLLIIYPYWILNTDVSDVIDYTPDAYNLSILDFKCPYELFYLLCQTAYNLSILDFKLFV